MEIEYNGETFRIDYGADAHYTPLDFIRFTRGKFEVTERFKRLLELEIGSKYTYEVTSTGVRYTGVNMTEEGVRTFINDLATLVHKSAAIPKHLTDPKRKLLEEGIVDELMSALALAGYEGLDIGRAFVERLNKR